MELDPKVLAELERLGYVSATVSAAFGGVTKSQKAQEIQLTRLTKIIKDTTNVSEAVAKQKAQELQDAEKQAVKEDDLARRREQALKEFGSNLLNITKSSISAGQAMYQSEAVFTSVVPTLQLMGTVVKATSSALASLGSGIPILEGIGKTAEKIIGVATDLTVQVAQMQLENAQKYLDTYKTLTKAGVTFGGDIDAMASSAAMGGLSLDLYAKFVTSNIENLKDMGGGLQTAADRVMHMSQAANKADSGLMVLYGGYEEMNAALAVYAGTMSKFGGNAAKDQASLSSTSAEYLRNLKELQERTGLNAESLKKEQEERAKHAAYALKIEEVRRTKGDLAASVLMNQVSEYTAMYGKEGGDYMEEFIALNGRVISETGQSYRAFNQVQARVAEGMAQNVSTDAKVRYRENARIVQSNESAVNAQAQYRRGVTGLIYATDDATIKTMNNADADMLAGKARREELGKLTDKQIEDRAKDLSKGAVAVKTAVDANIEYKKEVDRLTRESLPKMGELVVNLTKIQTTLVNTFGTDSMLVTAVNKFAKGLGIIADELAGEAPGKGQKPKAGTYYERKEQARQAELAASKTTGSAVGTSTSKYAELNKTPKGTVKETFTSEQLKEMFPGLRVKGDELTSGGGVNPSVVKAAGALQEMLGSRFGQVTAGNDKHHQDRKDKNGRPVPSSHKEGNALDFTTTPEPKNAEEAAKMKSLIASYLKEKGLSPIQILDEYFADRNPETKGGHFHVELAKMAKGGQIDSGGLAVVGEQGPEVVQGPATVTSKSDTSSLSSSLNTLNDHIATLVSIEEDCRSSLEKIARHTA